MAKDRKIRIAQVITRLDWGGSPDIYRILSNRLDRKGYDITLVVGHTEYPTAKTGAFLKSFKNRTVVIDSLRRDINPILDLGAFFKLYTLFRRGKFDVVHTHTAKAGALGRLAARLAGVPVIVHTPHGHNLYGYFGPMFSKVISGIEKLLSRITDKIVSLTELEKADYVKFKIADAGKLCVIYQGLELDELTQDWKEVVNIKKEFGIGEGDPVIGMVGRLEPVKGGRFFVEAAAQVSKKLPRAKFIIVGEGSLKARLEKLAEDLKIRDRAVFAGWRDDVAAIMSVMDVLVLPSLNEAVGMVLIEAQARSVPVVAASVGGIPEIIMDQRTGLLVRPSDASAIAKAVISLLSDREGSARMGALGREFVYNKFKAEDMAKKTADLYVELLNKKLMGRKRPAKKEEKVK